MNLIPMIKDVTKLEQSVPQSLELVEFLASSKARVDQRLELILPQSPNDGVQGDLDTGLEAAMRYSVFNGGKRFRPALVYATLAAFDVPLTVGDSSAAALELIHAYSLVHDDLPAMDDDDLRRGKPTCHIQFGEAVAILAGDALQTLAFAQLSADDGVQDPADRIELLRLLSEACGTRGMAGGQALDLQCENKTIDLDTLQRIHRLKTGRLIEASVEMALTLSDCSSRERELFKEYAQYLGLAFQIYDDILDEIGNTEEMGKPQGSDRALNKATYPSIVGLEAAKRYAYGAVAQCHNVLAELDRPTELLAKLADFVVGRQG